MKAIIVDDEGRSRRTLLALCEEYCTGLNVVGTAASVQEAKVLIEDSNPDLVFLDIKMPEENGFVLLESYEHGAPFEVIFTTAYEQYALQAFQASAVQYLLKPIDIDALIRAYEKARGRINAIVEVDDTLDYINMDNVIEQFNATKIALTTLDGFTFVRFDQIVRCAAEGNYTYVHFNDGSFLILTKTLKHYESLLEGKGFFRIHKSHLINLNYVRKFIKGKQGYIILSDGEKLEVSARKKEPLLKALG